MIAVFKQSNSEDFTNKIIGCSNIFYLGKSRTVQFANREVTVVLEESVRNQTIIIIAQPVNYTQIFEFLSTIDAARRSSAKEIIAVIPCLPHSRQERKANGERTSISARLFADMLQVAGLDRLVTMDVHTTAIEGFYKIPFDNLDPFKTIVEHIKSINGNLNPVLVSPDFGGMKRVKRYANELGIEMAFINKERLKPNEVTDMTLIGDVHKKDVIIIDDMVDTGTTLLKACELLDKEGANKIKYIYATHGIFSNDAIGRFATSHSTPYVVTTNTIPDLEKKTRLYVNFDIIDISKDFCDALLKIVK